MSWGADVLGVTEDTFQMIKAATTGITTTTGIAGIDLLSDLMSWVPVDTPFFNSVPRAPGKGATYAFWQTLLNVNGTQPTGGVKKGEAATVIKIKNQYTYSPYAVVGAGGFVNWDAMAQGEDYATVLAVDTLQTINQQLISLEIHQLNAQAFAVPTPAAPTVTKGSGGTIPTTKSVYVKVAARSGVNWYRGGAGVMSSAGHVTTTAGTSSVTASVSAVKTAAGYDWYVATGSGGTYFYYTTTPVNTVTITKIPTANQTIPTTYAGLYQAGQTGPSGKTATGTTHQSYWQNGLVASFLGAWPSSPDQALASGESSGLVTPGTTGAVTQGAYYHSNDGAALTVEGAGFAEIDNMNRKIYDTYQVTPSRMLMGSQVITDFANAFLDNPQAVTWLVPNASDGRGAAVMGGHVATYLNKTVNGKPIEMHLMPYLPPGKIISVIDSLPFPGSNVTSSLQVRTLYDFFRFDYGANRTTGATGGPRYDFEIRSMQAFVNKAAAQMGILDNIGAGVG